MQTKKIVQTTMTILLALTADLSAVIAQEPGFRMAGTLTSSDIPDDIHLDSMARLPAVRRADLDAVGRDAYDTYVSPGTGYDSGMRGPIGMLMHSPVLAKSMFDLREQVRYGTEKDQRLTELIILTTVAELKNQYAYTAHEILAREAGLEQEIIDVVRFRKSLSGLEAVDGFGGVEQFLVEFTRELVSGETLSSATFVRAVEMFGNEGVANIVGLIGYYNYIAIAIKAFDVHRPLDSELLLPIRFQP